MKQRINPEYLWLVGAVLIFIVLLLVGYSIKKSMPHNDSFIVTVNSSCELQQGKCTTSLANGASVSLLLTPNTIRVLHPLLLKVVVEGINISTVNIDFRGISMDMGYNSLTLSKDQEGVFVGETILPACTHLEMKWEARILLSTEQGVIMAPFQFSSRK